MYGVLAKRSPLILGLRHSVGSSASLWGLLQATDRREEDFSYTIIMLRIGIGILTQKADI